MSVKIGIDINTGNKILILDNGNGGTASQIALLSITTAPSGSFAVGSKYYNSTDKKIYTAITANTWTGATSADPVFNTIYTYNSEYYVWDGNSLEPTDLNLYEKIANKTDSYSETSPTKYPSSKALSDGLASKNMPSSIITSTQKIAVKGLSCISNDTPKILAKADIPLTYAAVKSKYDSTETEQSDITEIPLTDGVQHRCIYKENGEYFFSYNNQIWKSSSPDLSESSFVFDAQIYITDFLFYMGENANFILGNRDVAEEYKTVIEVYTKSNVYVKTLNLDVAITGLSDYTKFKDIDGLVYLCTTNALIRFADSVDITALELIYDSTSVKKVFAIEKLSNGKYVMPIINADDTKCVRVVANGSDFNTFTENIPSANYRNGTNFDMILDGTTLCLANSGANKYTSTDGETWTETNLPYINGVAFRLIKMGTTFKLLHSTTILSSTDFSGAFNVDKSFGIISDLDAVNSLYYDDTTVIFGEWKLLYSGVIKKVYTDVWGETTISYYKGIDTSCKICLTAQDTSLATIFQNYGQAPYFRLDINNETLTLPRIKNKYTYFQTLDTNYLESVDDMDSGDFSRNALATELNVFNEFTQTADKTFGNTTDETSIVGTGLGSVSFPANYFKYGKKLRITGWGVVSGASGTATTLKIKLGNTTITTNTSNLPTTLSNVKFDIAIDLTVRSTGTTGTVVCGGTTTIHASIGFGTATTRNFRTETPVEIDTTQALKLDATYQFGVASESNTITLSDLSVLAMN